MKSLSGSPVVLPATNAASLSTVLSTRTKCIINKSLNGFIDSQLATNVECYGCMCGKVSPCRMGMEGKKKRHCQRKGDLPTFIHTERLFRSVNRCHIKVNKIKSTIPFSTQSFFTSCNAFFHGLYDFDSCRRNKCKHFIYILY